MIPKRALDVITFPCFPLAAQKTENFQGKKALKKTTP